MEQQMERNRVREVGERIVEGIFFLGAFMGVISALAIIVFVFYKGLHPFFGENAYSFVDFIFGTTWAPGKNTYGIFQMIVASVFATGGAIIVGAWSGLLSGLLQQSEQSGNQRHGGNEEHIPSENQQTQSGGARAYDRGTVIFGAQPLLYEDGYKQGSEDEFDALKIDLQQRTGRSPQGGAAYPPDVVKERHPETVAVAPDTFRKGGTAGEGIGFIGEGKDHVRLFGTGPLVGIHHGDAVKQMPGVDHQSGQGGGDQSGTSGKQADSGILHGTGIDANTHGNGPKDPESALMHHNAESEAEKHISGHNRQGIGKGFGNCCMFHDIPHDILAESACPMCTERTAESEARASRNFCRRTLERVPPIST